MTVEWIQATLGSIAAKDGYGLVDGPFGSNLPASCYTEHGIPVIRGSNLTLGTSRFRAAEFVFVSRETAQRLERSLCRPFDIVFTKKGTLGQTGLVPDGGPYDLYLLSSNQMKLTVDRRLADPLFVYYFVSTPESTQKIIQDSEATGVPKTNVTYLRDFPITLPPLPEQRAIAHILGTLDDKIELNRQMNGTLEAMARTLFKSWFVDFLPVRAKMAARTQTGDPVRLPAEGSAQAGAKHALSKVEGAEGHPSTSSGQAIPGLPKHLADLFPDSFVDSELGEIPWGWEVKKLSELCSTQYGYTASAAEEPTGPKFLRVMDINKQNWVEWGSVPHCKIDEEEKKDYGLRVGDLVVARMADPGKSAIIEEEVDAVFASYLVRLKTASLARSYYIYNFLKSDLYAEYAAGTKSGSVQANMNAKVIVAADLAVPPEPLMERFLEVILPLRRRLISNVAESRTLAALRDALLPKLVSGEIRLDVQRATGRAEAGGVL
jgi:type I restriction enzyme S subunit